jgi:hypothetical protein
MESRRLAALAAAPITLSLAACGQGATGNEAQAELARCMRENGVAVPTPEPGGAIRLGAARVGREELETAMRICSGGVR